MRPLAVRCDNYDVSAYYGHQQTLTIKRIDYNDGTAYMRICIWPRQIDFTWQCTGNTCDISEMIDYSIRTLGGDMAVKQ